MDDFMRYVESAAICSQGDDVFVSFRAPARDWMELIRIEDMAKQFVSDLFAVSGDDDTSSRFEVNHGE